MNPANASNATASATTSSSEPSRESGSAAAKLTEAQYLQQQAEQAHTAIGAAFVDLKTDLANGVGPRAWMRTHPWLMLASAAVAGFAVAEVVVPSKGEPVHGKFDRIKHALNLGNAPKQNGDGPAAETKSDAGLLTMLISEIFAMLKPAIISLITTYISAPKEHDNPVSPRDEQR